MKSKMNMLEIVTLNKHGDFEEVLFSSLLSYLLNPKFEHGLKQLFLYKIVKEVFPDVSELEISQAEVESEHPLSFLGKDMGKVDVFIRFENKVLGIEVKIWDRSAKNISSENEPQLKRYCNALSEEFKNKDWRLLFVIPSVESKICLDEFRKVANDYRNNVRLMAWNSADSLPAESGIPDSCFISKSILDKIEEIFSEDGTKRVNVPLNTQWILDSLLETIPDLIEETVEPGRFPNKSTLEELPTWPIFESFFNAGKRWPISLHTAVGIPYGWGDDRLPFHDNSLYRIRTVTKYYTDSSDQEKYLPGEKVELELWPEVYKATEDSILNWLNKLGLNEAAVSAGRHVDSTEKNEVKLIAINKNVKVSTDNVEELNTILREGFRKSANKV